MAIGALKDEPVATTPVTKVTRSWLRAPKTSGLVWILLDFGVSYGHFSGVRLEENQVARLMHSGLWVVNECSIHTGTYVQYKSCLRNR